MKILYFTFMPPSTKLGGGLGVIKSLQALCRMGDVDYFGPEFDVSEVSDINKRLNKVNLIIMEKGNAAARLRNLFLYGSGSLFCREWEKAVSKISPSEYDVVYLERTLQGFVAKWARKADLPLVVMTHNVEYDFLRGSALFKRRLLKKLFLSNVRANEHTCINVADKVIVLTSNDQQRFSELYGNDHKYEIVPVCVSVPKSEGEAYKSHNPYILMTGSLWFGPNSEGIIWFLSKVWQKLSKYVKYDIVIAGSCPSGGLIQEAEKQERVYIIPNPDSMDKYFRGAQLYVAPIFDGAGMKVKIAEAMSYGLPIIATEHAMIGYEKAKDVVYCFNSAEDCIREMFLVENDSFDKRRDKEKKIYMEHYSSTAFYDVMRSVILNCIREFMET